MRGGRPRMPPAAISLAVDLASVTNCDHQDDHALVLQTTENPDSSDAIAPVFGFYPFEGLANPAWVVDALDCVSKEFSYP